MGFFKPVAVIVQPIVFLQSAHGFLQFWTVWLPEHVTSAHLIQVRCFRAFFTGRHSAKESATRFRLTLRATQTLRRTLIAKLWMSWWGQPLVAFGTETTNRTLAEPRRSLVGATAMEGQDW
jgi:hypothetical protein